MPPQQTARFIRDHGDEVTAEEIQDINQLLDGDIRTFSYDPNRSDSIKGHVCSDADLRDYLRYFKTGLRMGLRRPITYLESFVDNTYVYFVPYAKYPILPLLEFNRSLSLSAGMMRRACSFLSLKVYRGQELFWVRSMTR